MTIRRLAALTSIACCLLLVSTTAASLTKRPSSNEIAMEMMPLIVDTPAAALPPTDADPAASGPEPTDSATATSVAADEVQPAIVDVSPPTLVEIPADLIATPTPTSPTAVPLPFLTNIASTPRDSSVVYLTFDDGPDPVYTTQILDVLDRFEAKATFFVLGNSVDAYPGVVQRMVADGHAVGNHTYFHEALPRETADHVHQTLGATNAALARAVGRATSCLRPPYGALDQTTYDLVRGDGFSVQMWEVDSEDWKTNDAYTIAATVLSNTRLGDRVLFHDGPANRASTVEALESVLQVLTNRGVQFKALSC